MLDMTWTQYQTLLGSANSGVYGISQSSTQYLMQATAANQFNTSMLDLAKMSGVNANGLAYGTALAQSTQTSQFTMSGILAGRYMPVVYGVMFAIFTGASLLLLLLMLLPHPMQYIKMYLELLLWLTIWPALMAVYNFIVDLIIQWQASGYLSNYGGTLNGIAITNVHTMTNWVQTSLAWVGYLSWSIPMLSYAIVSGSAMAMTSMVGSMDSAVGGGVSSGASQLGTGNVSFGSMTARDMRIDDVASGNTKSGMYTDNMLSMNHIGGDPKFETGNVMSGEFNNAEAGVGTFTESVANHGTGETTGATGAKVSTVNGKVISATAPGVSADVGRTATTMATKSWNDSMTHSINDINSIGSQQGGAHTLKFQKDRMRTANNTAKSVWGGNWKHSKSAVSWWQWATGLKLGANSPVAPITAGGTADVQAGGKHETATERARIAQANAEYIKGIATDNGVSGAIINTSSSNKSSALNKSLAAGYTVADSYGKYLSKDTKAVMAAMPAYLNSRLKGSGLKGEARREKAIGIENRMKTQEGWAKFSKFLSQYNPMQGVGSSPSAVQKNYAKNAPVVSGSYANLSPSTSPAGIKAEIKEMQHLAKDSSDPGKGVNGKKHLLGSAKHAYNVDEEYASFYKKHGNKKAAATFSALGNREMATIKKIEKQKNISSYTFDGVNTKLKDKDGAKVKKKVPGENFK